MYDRLMPAFEELFDEVEEHTLNILLEPWTLLVGRDKESIQQVTTVHAYTPALIPFINSRKMIFLNNNSLPYQNLLLGYVLNEQ